MNVETVFQLKRLFWSTPGENEDEVFMKVGRFVTLPGVSQDDVLKAIRSKVNPVAIEDGFRVTVMERVSNYLVIDTTGHIGNCLYEIETAINGIATITGSNFARARAYGFLDNIPTALYAMPAELWFDGERVLLDPAAQVV